MPPKLPAPDPRELVIAALRSKSCVKQDIYERTQALFAEIKEQAEAIATDLDAAVAGHDKRLKVGFTDRGPHGCQLQLAGDLVIFHMHTNVFRLDQSHSLWKTSYLQEDEMRGYFGVVNIYNFLSDSLRFDRDQDLGYLVARLLLNKEGHFFMQGKRQLGFLYSDLQGNAMSGEVLRGILYAVANYVIEFDLLAPPYDQVQQVTVSEIKQLATRPPNSTGKRLGFRFQADVDQPS